MTQAAPFAIPQSEDDLLGAVLDLARWTGWLASHQRPAKTARGYRTAIQGDAGFPDLVLCHRSTGRVILAELKAERGRVSTAQQVWLDALGQGGTEVYLFRPGDWDTIERLLRGGRRR